MFTAFHNLSPSERGLVFGALMIAILGKLATISIYGPLAMGDNMGFVDAANEILAGTAWLSDAGLDKHALPPTLWRPIGYSLLIATSKALFADHWSIAICALQAALSLVAGIMLLSLCRRAGLGVGLSALVFLFYQWSAPLSTDALIMEDALTGSIGMMAFILVLGPIVEGRTPPLKNFLAAGMIAAISFLIRDVYHFVMPILAIGTLVVVARAVGFRRGLMAALALALPVFLVSSGLQAWNTHRTGEPVTTTAGQTAYLYGMLKAAQFDISILDGDDPVLSKAREVNKTFEYVDTRAINSALFRELGMNAVQQSQAASKLFWSTLFSTPLPMVKAALARTRIILQGTMFAGPLTRLDDLDWWRGGARADAFYGTGWRADAQKFRQSLSPADLTPLVAVQLAARTITRGVGLVLFALFVFLTPVLWWMSRKEQNGAAQAALVSWAVYALWVSMYVPVSFEVRYLAPVIGPALFSVALIFENRRRLIAVLRPRRRQ